MSKTPCILTLHPSNGIITSEQDIVAYVTRHFFSRTGRSSVIYEDMCPAFRTIESETTQSIDSLKYYVKTSLEFLYSQYFGLDVLEVTCNHTMIDEVNYTLDIEVRKVNDGNIILTDIVVTKTDDERYPFTINFNAG